jgi:hypothetical protein
VSFGPGLDPNRADDDTGGGDNLLEYPSDTIRAVRPPVETTDIGGNPRRAALATFSVDCGPLAPPFRFIAAGVSSEGWTFRVGQRYRRTFLHYRLVMPIRSLAPQGQSITPIFYNGAIICVPEIIAPGDPGDGRSRKHSVGPGMVIGSRGPWAVADGATWMKFLITAQSPPGDRQRRHPAGSLSVNLRTGAAAWTIAPGLSDAGSGRAASR